MKFGECVLFMIEHNGLFSFGGKLNVVDNKGNGNNVERLSWKNWAFS